MDLFQVDPAVNRLPCDGVVNYFGPVLGRDEAGSYFDALLHEVSWTRDELVIFGRRIVTARKVAWYGDPGLEYTYSGTTKRALMWNAPLRELKEKVQKLAGAAFNSCLLNLYHDGSEGMSWHSDDEPALARDAAIASVSLGAERKFCFRHKSSGATVSLVLEDGSLLVMKGATQRHWRHSLPKSRKVTDPRINLTFRTIVR